MRTQDAFLKFTNATEMTIAATVAMKKIAHRKEKSVAIQTNTSESPILSLNLLQFDFEIFNKTTFIFRCKSGSCILKKWVCDKEIDCKDGDDEQNCNYPTSANCTKEEFTCFNGHCIPVSIFTRISSKVSKSVQITIDLQRAWACDGVPDCSNGEDEQGCQMGCELTQFKCRVPANETSKTLTVSPQWLAKVRERQPLCISVKHVCDGEPDCPEKDGEFLPTYDYKTVYRLVKINFIFQTKKIVRKR